MFTCTKCGDEKPANSFRRNSARPNGLTAQCAECIRKHDRFRYSLGHNVGLIASTCGHCRRQFSYEKKMGPRRKYCSERCKANAGEAMRQVRVANLVRRCQCGSTDVASVGRAVCPDCRADKRDRTDERRRRQLSLYGLTQTQYDEMLAEQRGRCGVCATESPGRRGWFIDHDHGCCPGIGSCGACVRGLLCHDCNLLLGFAKDSTDRLEQAKKYLIANAQFAIPLRVVADG